MYIHAHMQALTLSHNSHLYIKINKILNILRARASQFIHAYMQALTLSHNSHLYHFSTLKQTNPDTWGPRQA